MFSRIRKRLTYANVAMTLALVFAMSGGAWAASKFVITSTKQIKPSVLKQLQGKTGPAGAAGLAGAAGAAGGAGPQGPAGAKGETGAPGAPGAKGEKGEKGAKGEKGEPWTAGGTLPKGSTETGTWAAGVSPSAELLLASISFTIPLAVPLTNATECGEPGKPACVTHVIGPGGSLPAGCTGSLAEPGAEAGNLCVFVAEKSANITGFTVHPNSFGGSGTGTTGAVIDLVGNPLAEMYGSGTWAVTG
jgi:hypothetical protein